MRRNLKRYYGAGDLHFLTFSWYHRKPLLGTPSRRDLFLSVLEKMRRRYQFVVVGYVIMPEHVHLLIGEPQIKNPSTVMQAIKVGFAPRVLMREKQKRDPAQARLFDGFRSTFGKSGSTTSMSGQSANGSKNFGTCIGIR